MAEDYVLPGDAFAPNGVVTAPTCCGTAMKDDGECSEGCCDYFKCEKCGTRIRLEYG